MRTLTSFCQVLIVDVPIMFVPFELQNYILDIAIVHSVSKVDLGRLRR